MSNPNSVRYPTELRERAVRMVLQGHREGAYASEWAAICAVAQMLGPTPETVRKWVRRAQATASGASVDQRERITKLERENRELRRANEILKAASASLYTCLCEAGSLYPVAGVRAGLERRVL